jgi:hypothetical protein
MGKEPEHNLLACGRLWKLWKSPYWSVISCAEGTWIYDIFTGKSQMPKLGVDMENRRDHFSDEYHSTDLHEHTCPSCGEIRNCSEPLCDMGVLFCEWCKNKQERKN